MLYRNSILGKFIKVTDFKIWFSDCYKNEGPNWMKIESMIEGRYWFTLTTVGDMLLATGGVTPTG